MIVVVQMLPDSQMEMLEKQSGIQDRWRVQCSLHDHNAMDIVSSQTGTIQREVRRNSGENKTREESSWQVAENIHEKKVKNRSIERKLYSEEIWGRRKDKGWLW